MKRMIICVMCGATLLSGCSGSAAKNSAVEQPATEQVEASSIEESMEEVLSSRPEAEPVVDPFAENLSQQNALAQARSYLSFSAFSYQGLINQLSSEYGSGYPVEDAVAVVDYLTKSEEVNWNDQAIKQAESYLKHSAFSKAGLIRQLSSEHGSQYTEEQAEYAVDYLEQNSLVDWNEQAAKQAQSYMEHSSFSKDGLIKQLESEHGSQFTHEEALYGAQAVGY